MKIVYGIGHLVGKAMLWSLEACDGFVVLFRTLKNRICSILAGLTQQFICGFGNGLNSDTLAYLACGVNPDKIWQWMLVSMLMISSIAVSIAYLIGPI